MNRLNWKTGLKRLYFVGSAIWYCIVAFEILENVDYGYAFDAQTIVVLLLFIAAPFVVYNAAKWIYQGLQPKLD